jgi:hypothetical protein
MASVEFEDETVIAVRPDVLMAVLSDRGRWPSWWPGLTVALVEDRGTEGATWSVSGPLVGATRVRLASWQSSTVVVHYTFSAEPTAPGSSGSARRLPDSPHGQRMVQAMRRRQAMAWKAAIWAIKDEVEGRI